VSTGQLAVFILKKKKKERKKKRTGSDDITAASVLTQMQKTRLKITERAVCACA